VSKERIIVLIMITQIRRYNYLIYSIISLKVNIFLMHDEQNGFRRNRNTIDHLSSITNIIETRKLRKLSTFAAFVDFKKAYDSVNRALLFDKLEELGISSKMIRALRSLYNNVQSCIKLNGNLTDWFSVNTGLKQGCII